MKYRVVIQLGPNQYERYSVYNHTFEGNCLILHTGSLKRGVKELHYIPVGSFVSAWTEDLD